MGPKARAAFALTSSFSKETWGQIQEQGWGAAGAGVAAAAEEEDEEEAPAAAATAGDGAAEFSCRVS